MDRREFTKVMGAVAAGMLAGSKAFGAEEAKKTDAKAAEAHVCKGHNACKGQGSCAGAGHACAGKNACKGEGVKQMSKAECDAAKAKAKS